MSCSISALFEVLGSGDPEEAAQVLGECTAVLTDPMLWIYALAFTVVCGVVGALIGARKNAIGRDLALGLLLGPIGWVISLLLPASTPPRRCPACGVAAIPADKFCRQCGAALAK